MLISMTKQEVKLQALLEILAWEDAQMSENKQEYKSYVARAEKFNMNFLTSQNYFEQYGQLSIVPPTHENSLNKYRSHESLNRLEFFASLSPTEEKVFLDFYDLAALNFPRDAF